jgi:hypothetical protein
VLIVEKIKFYTSSVPGARRKVTSGGVVFDDDHVNLVLMMF